MPKNDIVKLKIDIVNIKVDTVNDTVSSLIEKNKNITSSEISQSLKISLSTANRQIKKLKDQGKIDRIGSDKTGYWKVNE